MKYTENTRKVENAITWKMSGKMLGMASLSTSAKGNKICQNRAKHKDTICAHCYAMALLEYRKNLETKTERNADFLGDAIIPTEEMPFLNASIFRIEAYGDLRNEIQAENYLNLIEANPHVQFGWWTKNPWLIARVLKHRTKPENVQIVYSSPYIGKTWDMRKLYPFIDKVFTVYTKEYAKAHAEEINCGARSCMACQRCYHANSETFINEILK